MPGLLADERGCHGAIGDEEVRNAFMQLHAFSRDDDAVQGGVMDDSIELNVGVIEDFLVRKRSECIQ